jgi:hypothetical protein
MMIDVEEIIRYENGEMDMDEIVEFFGKLIRSGTIPHLQGHYHRIANQLVQDGLIGL